ncbi:NUDIX hydrolase [Naumannella huperziae]
MDRDIRVSAVVVRDAAGRVLTVRKRGTTRFMLPGGKPEPGEDPAAVAVREFAEELSGQLDHRMLRPLGRHTAAAANEPRHRVVATVFEHPLIEPVAPAAEIAELRWVDPAAAPGADLAPLLADAVFPMLAQAAR